MFKGDYLNIILALQSADQDYSTIGCFIYNIKSFVHSFESVSFTFVSRTWNSLAHLLSQHIVLDCDGACTLPQDILCCSSVYLNNLWLSIDIKYDPFYLKKMSDFCILNITFISHNIWRFFLEVLGFQASSIRSRWILG